jgi:hypothetical protein
MILNVTFTIFEVTDFIIIRLILKELLNMTINNLILLFLSFFVN